MRGLPVIFAALSASLALGAPALALAQSATPRQIQTQIAQGQEQAALAELQGALQAHPDSSVAWYLTAEAQDAAGNETAARDALSNAERYAPGLPFAAPGDVASLRSHLAGGDAGAPTLPVARHAGIGPVLAGIVGLVFLFLLLRMFFRRRFYQGGYPAGIGQPGGPGPYPYGPGGFAPGGMGGGLGGGLGGSILGGLAAGAGFAAGERVIDDAFGRGNDQPGGGFQQEPNVAPDRDDGLQGNPGWDDGSGQSGNFDPGNNW